MSRTSESSGGEPERLDASLSFSWDRQVWRAIQVAIPGGTEVEPGTDAAEATSVAQATLDAEGRATYTFDLSWDVPEVTDLHEVAHVHTGSIGATLEPGGAKEQLSLDL